MRKLTFLIVVFFLTAITINAQTPPPPTFTGQLSLIISLGEIDQFKSIQGDLLGTAADGSKIYSFPLALQGFKMSIEQSPKGKVVVANSISMEAVSGNVSFLLDRMMRMMGEMSAYTSSDYKAAYPKGLEAYEAVTELSKEGSVVKVQVRKKAGGKEYSLVIMPY